MRFRIYRHCNELIYFGPLNFALAVPLTDAPLLERKASALRAALNGQAESPRPAAQGRGLG